jgi:hypothetical protein
MSHDDTDSDGNKNPESEISKYFFHESNSSLLLPQNTERIIVPAVKSWRPANPEIGYFLKALKI